MAMNYSLSLQWQRIVGCQPPALSTDRALTTFLIATPYRTLVYAESAKRVQSYVINYPTLLYTPAPPFTAWTGFRAIRPYSSLEGLVLEVVDPLTNRTITRVHTPITDLTTSVALSPEGLFVVVGTESGDIRLYSAENGDLLATVKPSSNTVENLFVSWFALRLIAQFYDEIMVFERDLEQNTLRLTYNYTLPAAVFEIYTTPSCNRTVVICMDGTVLLLESGDNSTMVYRWRAPEGLIDAAPLWYSNALAILYPESVEIHDLRTGVLTESIPLDTGESVLKIACSWDGKFVYVATTCRLWLIDEQRHLTPILTTSSPAGFSWVKTSPSGGRVLAVADYDAIYLLTTFKDDDSPYLAILEPKAEDIGAGKPIRWSTADASTWIEHSAIVIDDKYCVDVDQATEYLPEYAWEDGWHNISVRVYDAVGHQTEAQLRIYLDLTPPNVVIHSPHNFTITNKDCVTVMWESTDNRGVIEQSIWLNTTLLETIDASATTALVSLPEDGPWNITIVAYDRGGNTGSASVYVIRDTNPPTITIIQPTNHSTIDEPFVSIRWRIEDEWGVREAWLTIDGESPREIPEEGSLVLSPPQEISYGTHTITIQAIDHASNTRVAGVVIVVKAKPVTEPLIYTSIALLILIGLTLTAYVWKAHRSG